MSDFSTKTVLYSLILFLATSYPNCFNLFFFNFNYRRWKSTNLLQQQIVKSNKHSSANWPSCMF